jgi:NADH pyrophosphatase NudC (nudix superfamily)
MTNQKHDETHVHAYERMLERVRDFVSEARDEVAPKLQHGLDDAREKATELGELSREEAEKIGNYLKRDVYDAAIYLASEKADDMKAWLRFDVQLVEERIAESFALLVDKTTIELKQLADRAREVGEWHTGEITGPGTLICKECGEEIHFHKTGHIPPCPKCHATVYRRGQEPD